MSNPRPVVAHRQLLRQHRGLFASEGLGTLEKFRPYGIPTDAWLDEVRNVVQRNG